MASIRQIDAAVHTDRGCPSNERQRRIHVLNSPQGHESKNKLVTSSVYVFNTATHLWLSSLDM